MFCLLCEEQINRGEKAREKGISGTHDIIMA
jgi:hypothetical protein